MVTGASGLFGQSLTRQLLLEGKPVRILLRDMYSPGFEGLTVEKVHGSITDLDTLLTAFEGIDTVFHSAGLPSNLPGMYEHLYHVNVRGTENVIEACRARGVKHLVFIANFQALVGNAIVGMIDESFPFRVDHARTEYGRTMAIACQRVEQAHERGLSTTIILPSYQIGPYDYKLSVLGRFIWDFARGRVPVLVHGGIEIIDTRDLASITATVAREGKTGERYLVSSGLIEVEELTHWLEAVSGKDAPRHYLPQWAMYPAALFMEAQYCLHGDQPVLIVQD